MPSNEKKPTRPPLLIVDDDEEILTQLKWGLGEDYEVSTAENRPHAITAFRKSRPLATLLDLGLPPKANGPEEGLATLSAMLALDGQAKVIIVSGQSERETAIRAVGEGAYDMLSKPVDMDELRLVLKRSVYVAEMEREYSALQDRLGSDAFEGLLGASPPMQEAYAFIRKVATTDAPVLILGESGTGKELAAHAIHRRSQRGSAPFVAINCGAIPESLLESELFGHEKGAFTGAHTQRKGRIEMAVGGTLFLDEIGELPPLLQVKILRFLQEKQIERVGGRELIEVDARIIAATNRDLKREMEEGGFREDLFYRLAVVVLKMPALRDREGDIQLLAHSFLRRFGAEDHRQSPEFTSDAMRALGSHGWPGNVRELENKVKRALIMADGRHITAGDLELRSPAGNHAGQTLREAREELEREMVEAALQRKRGNISASAAELGISRPTLYELLEKFGLRKSSAARKKGE